MNILPNGTKLLGGAEVLIPEANNFI